MVLWVGLKDIEFKPDIQFCDAATSPISTTNVVQRRAHPLYLGTYVLYLPSVCRKHKSVTAANLKVGRVMAHTHVIQVFKINRDGANQLLDYKHALESRIKSQYTTIGYDWTLFSDDFMPYLRETALWFVNEKYISDGWIEIWI
ncbi:uncharacterized protein LOC107273386 [Cephus cinctus]|uniref:Uncharacterized protein LOC107273386 n=1 Tax=Cephus cinctus TaxID=211228 RepID=A0AAJ7RTU5_CEPCN|nr:uncharacterized protein LOC107273386 [Cephus cinctus]